MIRAWTLASGATATLLLLRVAVGGPLGAFAGLGQTAATFNSAVAATATAMARRRGVAADDLRIKLVSPDAFHAGESRAREAGTSRDAESSAHAALLGSGRSCTGASPRRKPRTPAATPSRWTPLGRAVSISPRARC